MLSWENKQVMQRICDRIEKNYPALHKNDSRSVRFYYLSLAK